MPTERNQLQTKGEQVINHITGDNLSNMQINAPVCKEKEKKKEKAMHLINHERKITVAMNPLSEHVVYYGFTCRSNLPEPQEVQQSKPKLRS